MVIMMDALQCCGVQADVASSFAASLLIDKPRVHAIRTKLEDAMRFVGAVTDRPPNFIEAYGQGRIVDAANGCRRNLNIAGLDALDLRTHRADWTAWSSDLPSHR